MYRFQYGYPYLKSTSMFSEIWTGADEEKQKKKHKSEGKNHKKKVIKF